jgi:hypothetical protein
MGVGQQILNEWLSECTRHGKVSRNSVAIGIVVLDHLVRACPVSRDEVVSQGGEISGARSGLGPTLARYGVPSDYLKEVTTRQAHQDGQRLFERLDWGRALSDASPEERRDILTKLIDDLTALADAWMRKQSLRLDIDRRHAPTTWVNMIIDGARGHSGGVVEQHLVGAKLQRRFPSHQIPNHPAHAGDSQTERAGDFAIAGVVYHVTASPSPAVVQKCARNLLQGLHPVLLVPQDRVQKAQLYAEDEHIRSELTILSIEDFVAMNIVELALAESKDLFAVLQEMVEIYNLRLSSAETDMSLQITIR